MATLVSASRAQRASGHARLARRVADALAGAIPLHSASTPAPATLKSSGGSWRPLCSGPASGLRSRNGPSVCSATQAWHVSARHGTYRWTTSLRSWMKAAPRYAARTAARLRALSGIIGERYDGRAAMIGQQFSTCPALRAAQDVLPGGGPVTIQLFLRELRGVWPGRAAAARPARRVRRRHLGILGPGPAPAAFVRLARLAAGCYTGRQDLESGLVRLALADHRRGWAYARGGHLCVLFS